jgi:NAD(P)H-nitrite reductase large subunit
MEENRVVCHCQNIDLKTINEAIATGCKTLEEIQSKTGAGTVCGACVDEINEIIAAKI